jgi:hypothetical protein
MADETESICKQYGAYKMSTLEYRGCKTRASVLSAIGATLCALCFHSPAQAQNYDVTLDTSSLLGSGSTLTFDFISGGGTQSNSVSILDFSTDGSLLSGGVNSGSVSGALPGTVILTNASFFNELQQGITLGSTSSFQLVATTNAPTDGSLPDTLSVFLLDPTGSSSLTSTNDPTGSNSLLTLQIDGTSIGSVAAYGSSSPLVPVTVKAAVTNPMAAPEIDASSTTSALTLLVGVLCVLRGRPRQTPQCVEILVQTRSRTNPV